MIVTKLFKIGMLFLTGVVAHEPVTQAWGLIQLLHTSAEFSNSDLANLQAGNAVAKVLGKHSGGELALAGAMRVKVPLELFLDEFREMPTLERGREALVVGRLSDPPRIGDLQRLTLSRSDVDALSACVPGNCDLKLSAAMMEKLRQESNTSATVDHMTALSTLFRALILDYVSGYVNKGDTAMVKYVDKTLPVQGSTQFLQLLEEFDWLRDYAPPLYDCLGSYSGSPCPTIERFLYWSTAKFGMKPVLTINHVMIYTIKREDQTWMFIALKQIFANHYFESSLGVAVLLEEATPVPEIWAGYIQRSHIDALHGWLGPFKRAIVESKSRGAMEKDLLELKINLERRYQTASVDSAQ